MTEKEKVITEIQQILRRIAKSESDVPAIIPDGIYSEETSGAVRDFQRRYGLAVTGKVDYSTFEALVRENERLIFENSPPLQVLPIGNEDLPLSYGDENEAVEKLKIMLNALADKHGNFLPLVRNSLFDADTREMVRKWQSVIFTRETGEVDKETWNSLVSYYLIQ